MSRRGFLAASAACALGERLALAAPGSELSGFSSHLLETGGFGADGIGGLMYVPNSLVHTQPSALLVLLHGYSPHNVGRRAMASWVRDYGVLEAYEQLQRSSSRTVGNGSAASFSGLFASAMRARFHGLVLVCPVTPSPYLDPKWSRTMDRYAGWLADELLPAARRRLPELADTVCGLAGVSMGGHVGLEVLTRRPEVFASFTAVQAAIKMRQARSFARRLRAAFGATSGGPNPIPLKVVTSSFDIYRGANEQLVSMLDALGLPAEIEVKPGTHTRDWMQRVGSVETLAWQDRVLRQILDAQPTTLLRAVGERCPCASSG